MYFFSITDIRAKARQTLNQTPGIFSLAAIPVVLALLVNIFSQVRTLPSQYDVMDMSDGQALHLILSTLSFPLVLSLLIGFLALSIQFALLRIVRQQQESASYTDSVRIFNHPQFGKITATYLLRSLILFVFSFMLGAGVVLMITGLVMMVAIAFAAPENTSYVLVGLIPLLVGFLLFAGGIALYLPFYYSYSLMDIILYDQLENGTYTGPWAVLKESARLMKGYKQKAFLLDLSLIGWYILSGITFGIAGIYVIPYTGLAHIYFYQALLADREQKQFL